MTIVVLHGWLDSKNSWKNFTSQFEGATPVVALDLPGFGAEPLISDDWGIPEFAQWVTAKISELKLTDVLLIGHSFGGRIAAHIASQYPNWLKGLVLYGTPALYRPSLKIKFKIYAAKVLKFLGIKRSLLKNADLTEAKTANLSRIFRKVVVFDQTSELPKINIPTLILIGSNDTDARVAISQEMHSLIAESKLILLNNAGHYAHITHPFLFYGTIKNFIETL